MKKLLPLGLPLVLLAGCSDEGGDAPVEVKYLEGKWNALRIEVDGAENSYPGNKPCGKDYIEFKETGVLNIGDVTGCDGNTPLIENRTGTYEVADLKLYIDVSGGDNRVFDLTKLSADRMKIKYTDDQDGDGTAETIIETYGKIE